MTLDLGTCVRVSLDARRRYVMAEEGVVVEVVPPGGSPRSARVAALRRSRPEVGYVVQCWSGRVLRRAPELVVVSP